MCNNNLSEDITQEQFRGFLILSSVPLRQLGVDLFPVNVASGRLIDYGSRRWILTVEHTTGNMGKWVIEIVYEEGRGTKLHQIGTMHFVKRGTVGNNTLENLDMAYAQVRSDLQPRFQQSRKGRIIGEEPRIVLRDNLRSVPTQDSFYGFAGNIQPTDELHFGQRYLGSEIKCYSNLKYVGEDDNFYFFRLPFKHPGGEFFKGTSGSPICGSDCRLVALVCGSGKEPDTIRGIKISHFRIALDVELVAS